MAPRVSAIECEAPKSPCPCASRPLRAALDMFRGNLAGAPQDWWEDWSPSEDDLALLLSPVHEQAPAPAPPRPAKRARRSRERQASPYRGVSFHGRTGRCEAHIWINGMQARRGGGLGGAARCSPPCRN